MLSQHEHPTIRANHVFDAHRTKNFAWLWCFRLPLSSTISSAVENKFPDILRSRPTYKGIFHFRAVLRCSAGLPLTCSRRRERRVSSRYLVAYSGCRSDLKPTVLIGFLLTASQGCYAYLNECIVTIPLECERENTVPRHQTAASHLFSELSDMAVGLSCGVMPCRVSGPVFARCIGATQPGQET